MYTAWWSIKRTNSVREKIARNTWVWWKCKDELLNRGKLRLGNRRWPWITDSSRSKWWVLFYNLPFIVYNFLDGEINTRRRAYKYGARAFWRIFSHAFGFAFIFNLRFTMLYDIKSRKTFVARTFGQVTILLRVSKARKNAASNECNFIE